MTLSQQFSWSGLSGRERSLVVVGMLVVLTYVLYTGVLEPHYKKYAALERQVPEKIDTYAWMKHQAQQIKPLLNQRAQPTTLTTGGNGLPLVSTVENSLKQMGIADNAKRILPGDNGEVKIWFADIEFNQWLLWLDQLKNRDIHVTRARVERSQPGLTHIQVSLRSHIAQANPATQSTQG